MSNRKLSSVANVCPYCHVLCPEHLAATHIQLTVRLQIYASVNILVALKVIHDAGRLIYQYLLSATISCPDQIASNCNKVK